MEHTKDWIEKNTGRLLLEPMECTKDLIEKNMLYHWIGYIISVYDGHTLYQLIWKNTLSLRLHLGLIWSHGSDKVLIKLFGSLAFFKINIFSTWLPCQSFDKKQMFSPKNCFANQQHSILWSAAPTLLISADEMTINQKNNQQPLPQDQSSSLDPTCICPDTQVSDNQRRSQGIV